MTAALTHLCCPDCRLRFTPAAAAHLGACPDCGEPMRAASLKGTFGFRIVRLEDVPHAPSQARGVDPRSRPDRSATP